MKKYSKNKIEADNLIKQIRQKIKETTWEKQNLREGFTETFKPLISQFENPGEDSKKQNLFTQNQKMLQNQLALTEGIRTNQKAITDGFSQFERLADMQELPGIGAIEDVEEEKDSEDEKDDQARAPTPKEDKSPIIKSNLEKNLDKVDKQKKILKYNLEKNLDEVDKQNLDLLGYPQPNELLNKEIYEINQIYEMVKNDVKIMGTKIGALKRTKNKTEEQELDLELFKIQQKTQKDYRNILKFYLDSLNYKIGQGLYSSPQKLLHRLELLNGSLTAGNNGVLPELIKILHRLRDLGILTNNQLNKLLRKVI